MYPPSSSAVDVGGIGAASVARAAHPGFARTSTCKRLQSLQVEKDVNSNAHRIWWTVDARKLASSDREAVSTAFNLGLPSGPAQFKIIIRPTVVSTDRRGSCFKKAKGKGSVELRCLEQMDSSTHQPLRFRLAVGSHGSWGEEARGPVEHNFADRALCSLPEPLREWDFGSHVDRQTQTFDVCLEILAGISDAWLGEV